MNSIKQYQQAASNKKIANGYRALMAFLEQLRTEFIHTFPSTYYCGKLNKGNMDFSYFSCTPEALKNKKLKTVLLFDHKKWQFEAWLTGQNKKMTHQYRSTLAEKPDMELAQDADGILQQVLIANVDFSDMETIQTSLLEGFMQFIHHAEGCVKG